MDAGPGNRPVGQEFESDERKERIRMRYAAWRVIALLPGLLLVPHAPAQSVSTEITGEVRDPAGMLVRGAAVTLTNTDTNLASRAETNQAGVFRLGGLSPGVYTLTAQRDGFQTRRVEGIRLLAGQRYEHSVVLDVATVAQEVTVNAESQDMRSVSTHGVRGGALTSEEASRLPLQQGVFGRNFGGLMLNMGGVYPRRGHTPFVANGNRPHGTLNVMVDSAEFNDVLSGAVMGRGITEQPVSMEAVESVEIQTSSFKAESGRASGAVVNLVTRSGGNQWRGSLYYLGQNSALDARNAMLAERPPAYTHVPGMTLGGPLRRNRVFFFGGYENTVRNTFSGSTRVMTLTAAERARAIPAMRPLVDLFPEPNVEGTNLYITNVPSPRTLKSITGRIDAQLSANHRLSYRQTFMKDIGYRFTAIPAASRDGMNGNLLSSANLDSTLGPRLFNQFRVAYSQYQNPQRLTNPYFGDPSLHGLVGSLWVTGLTPVTAFRANVLLTTHNYSVSDDLSYVAGRHMLKAGFVFRRLHANTAPETNFFGTLGFRNVPDFLAGRPLSYTINTGNPRLDLRGNEVGFYVQDDWRVSRNLTLNLGLRYEYFSVPVDQFGRLPPLYRPDRNNFAPRFGFAYDIGGQLKTVIRGGYGIYYNPIILDIAGDTRFAPPLVTGLTAANPGIPPNLAGARMALDRTTTEFGLRPPMVQSWNLTLERSLSSATVVSAAYVGTKADGLARSRQPNGGPNLPQHLRPDPSQGVITRRESSASSNFHSLQLTARSSLRNGLIFRAAYTFGKSIDNASGHGAIPLSEGDIRLDRGVSDFNVPHMFNAHVLYPLPWIKRNRWIGGWQVGGLATATSGSAFSILSNTNNLGGALINRVMDMPGTILRGGPRQAPLALAPGVTTASIVPAPGTLGGLRRNSEISPAFFGLNVTLMKNFLITERVSFEFRVESFNVLNRVNFGVPVNNIANPLFGTILSAADPRQFQLSARLQF
jgi:hypothetical protein